MKTFPAKFLNVDLDIKSKLDHAVLVKAWRKTCVLQSLPMDTDKAGHRHWLRGMLPVGPRNPTDAIRRYAKLVRGLPEEARIVWDRASKELDIGVQAGFDR